MRIAMLTVVLATLILSGCTQMAENAGGDLQTCISKCSDVCDLVKQENLDLEGFTQIGLEKQQGSVSITCQCVCD